jgi:uncharacterized protein YbjT (DUF2867 family)
MPRAQVKAIKLSCLPGVHCRNSFYFVEARRAPVNVCGCRKYISRYTIAWQYITRDPVKHIFAYKQDSADMVCEYVKTLHSPHSVSQCDMIIL